jgi:hypothetical protein
MMEKSDIPADHAAEAFRHNGRRLGPNEGLR